MWGQTPSWAEYPQYFQKNPSGKDFELHCSVHVLMLYWSISRFQCVFNSRHNYNMNYSRNRVMGSCFDGGNNTTILFPNTVGNIFFNDLIRTSTLFTERYTPRPVSKTINLYSYCLVLNNTWVVITTNSKSVEDSFYSPRRFLFWCLFFPEDTTNAKKV